MKKSIGRTRTRCVCHPQATPVLLSRAILIIVKSAQKGRQARAVLSFAPGRLQCYHQTWRYYHRAQQICGCAWESLDLSRHCACAGRLYWQAPELHAVSRIQGEMCESSFAQDWYWWRRFRSCTLRGMLDFVRYLGSVSLQARSAKLATCNPLGRGRLSLLCSRLRLAELTMCSAKVGKACNLLGLVGLACYALG